MKEPPSCSVNTTRYTGRIPPIPHFVKHHNGGLHSSVFRSLTVQARNLYNQGLPLALGGQMYAVIQTGGKQYRVAPGDTIRIERVDGKVGKR